MLQFRLSRRLFSNQVLFGLTFASLGSGLLAQGVWKRLATSGPTGRRYSAMAYDSARQRTVLYGGWDGKSVLSDTWEWDGNSWSQIRPKGATPGKLMLHGMTFDPQSREVLLFGGASAAGTLSGFSSATWSWNGKRWRLWSPAGSPAARVGAAMATDERRRRVVLFGGHSGGSKPARLGDTWEWSAGKWTIAASTGPGARDDHAMVYDSVRGVTVLFGGNSGGNYRNDTWSWNGKVWKSIPTTAQPTARRLHSLAFDSTLGRVLLFGGDGGKGGLSDSWEWNGTKWSQLRVAASPVARFSAAAVFDLARRDFLIFGGQGRAMLADTQAYSGITRASVSSYGKACPNSSTGLPHLTLANLPVISWDLIPNLSNAPNYQPVAVLLGTKALSISLRGAGMGSCSLYVLPAVLLISASDGKGGFVNAPRIPIPRNPALAGLNLYLQAFPLDRKANRAGVIATNGVRATVGH